jgi:hypothetical protein
VEKNSLFNAKYTLMDEVAQGSFSGHEGKAGKTTKGQGNERKGVQEMKEGRKEGRNAYGGIMEGQRDDGKST